MLSFSKVSNSCFYLWLRGDLMDYKTFSCEEPSCASVECQLLWTADKQRKDWLYGNFLFSGSGHPFWNFLPPWPLLGNAHVLQLECIYTHGLRQVPPPTLFSAPLTHWAKISTPHTQSQVAASQRGPDNWNLSIPHLCLHTPKSLRATNLSKVQKFYSNGCEMEDFSAMLLWGKINFTLALCWHKLLPVVLDGRAFGCNWQVSSLPLF